MTEAGEWRARRDKEQTHAGAPGTARREDRGGAETNQRLAQGLRSRSGYTVPLK